MIHRQINKRLTKLANIKPTNKKNNMKTIKINLYDFNELSETAKNKAIETFRNEESENYEFDFFVDDSKEFLIPFGFANVDLRYSLNHCQGDGVSFFADADIGHFLHDFFKGKRQTFSDAIHNNFAIVMKKSSRYAFASRNDIELRLNSDYFSRNSRPNFNDLLNQFEEFVQDAYMNLCNQLEKQGYSEIEYYNSNEFISEELENYGDVFLENGTILNY